MYDPALCSPDQGGRTVEEESLVGIPHSHTNNDLLSYPEIRGWVDACSKETCNRASRLPCLVQDNIRLVDVLSQCLVKPGLDADFLALSYVWGPEKEKDDKLLRSNLHILSRPGGIGALTRLSRTLEDAFEVTKQLGFRYLFVDRLCIVQDDDQDMDIYVQTMHQVFSRASVTIIAAAGGSADAGLPGTRGTPRTRRVALTDTSGLPTSDCRKTTTAYTSHMAPRKIIEDALRGTTWATRGWTFQEKLLSSRLLIFTEDLVLWKCPHAYLYENCPRPCSEYSPATLIERPYPGTDDIFISDIPIGNLAPPQSRPPLQAAYSAPPVLKRFRYLVQKYSRRSLTFPEDISKAFSGVVSTFEARFPSFRFHFALPTQFLPSELQWRCAACVSRHSGPHPKHVSRRDAHDDAGRPLFPSWSWLAWQGEVCWDLERSAERGIVTEDPRYGVTSDMLVRGSNGHVTAYAEGRPDFVDLGAVKVPGWASTHPRRDHALIFRALVKRISRTRVCGPKSLVTNSSGSDADPFSQAKDRMLLWLSPSKCADTSKYTWLQRPSLDVLDRDVGLVCLAFMQRVLKDRVVDLAVVMVVSYDNDGSGQAAFREGMFECERSEFLAAVGDFRPETVFLC